MPPPYGKGGKGKSSWTCMTCSFTHPPHHTSCGYCADQYHYHNRYVQAPLAPPGGNSHKRRWGQSNAPSQFQWQNQNQHQYQYQHFNQQHDPYLYKGKGKGKGTKAAPPPSPPPPPPPPNSAAEGAFLLQAMRKFGPKFLPAELMSAIEKAVPDNIPEAAAAAPRAVWQEVQSVKDKIRYAESAIDKLDSQLDDAKAHYFCLKDARDAMRDKRASHIARLEDLQRENPDRPCGRQRNEYLMCNWIKDMMDLTKDGINSIDPAKFTNMINNPPPQFFDIKEQRYDDERMNCHSIATSPERQADSDEHSAPPKFARKEGKGGSRARPASLEPLPRRGRRSERMPGHDNRDGSGRSYRSRSSPPRTLRSSH